jgi:hypothetical protein
MYFSLIAIILFCTVFTKHFLLIGERILNATNMGEWVNGEEYVHWENGGTKRQDTFT